MSPALDSLLRRIGRRPSRTPDKPLRDELLSIERLEERAKALAARLTIDPTPGRNARDVFPRFADNARVLREAYRALAEDVHQGEFVTPAEEWLLDNFHLVASEIRDVRQNLPRGYYRELPKLATRQLKGDARVYATAVELIRHSDSRLDRHQLLRFMNSYQTVAPLTIGELWAWPSMLKLALIENLRRLAEEASFAREARRAADAYVAQIDAGGQGRPPPLPPELHPAFVVQLLQLVREYGPRLAPFAPPSTRTSTAQQTASEEAIRGEHQRQAAAQVSVANVITSLRLVLDARLERVRRAVSLVEQVLQRDPAGVYGRMDFLSRDRYRQAVEDLADRTGEGQVRVALRPSRARARRPRATAAERARVHVGYHLIGKGRADLETDVAYRPRLRRRATTPGLRPRHGRLPRGDRALDDAAARPRRRLRAAAQRLGLGARLGVSAVAAAGERGGHRPRPARVRALRRPAAPAAPRLPGRRARERADHGRRADAAPRASSGSSELLEHLEVQALGNLDPHIHFAILSDFPDAPAREHAGRRGDPRARRAQGIEALNARHADGHADRFFLVPPRAPLEPERRRLDGLGAQARQDRGVQPPAARRHRHELLGRRSATLRRPAAGALLPHARLRHAPAARRGEEARSASSPIRSTARASTRALRPRHRGLRHPPAARERDDGERRRLAVRARSTPATPASIPTRPRSPTSTRTSSARASSPARGSTTSTPSSRRSTAACPRTRSCRTICSRGSTRARRSSPTSRSSTTIRRASSRTRAASTAGCAATGRSCWWLFPFVPTRAGLRAQPAAAHLALEDLRQPAPQPGRARDRSRCSCSPGRCCPGSRGGVDGRGARRALLPVVPARSRRSRGPPPQQPLASLPARGAPRTLRTALAQAVAAARRSSPSQAWEMVHAIGLTLVRLAVTQRRLLEWETAAASAARRRQRSARRASSWPRCREPADRAARPRRGRLARRPTRWPVALPVLALWAAAPLVALRAQPARRRRAQLELDRRGSRVPRRRRARRPGATSTTFIGPDDHGLPPDNFQETPDADGRPPHLADEHRHGPAGDARRRTTSASSTPDELVARIDATLTTIEGLERYEGHLLNWYDTQSLAPLPPRYVSTVDSGNLAGALIDARRGAAPGRPSDALARQPRADSPIARRAVRRHELPLPLRPAAPALLDRLPPRRRRGPGPPRLRRTTTCWPRRRGSRASSRSPRATCRETHWFHLGRPVTSVHGTPTLLSWSASLFEYLMPLLVMRSYPETLLDQSCRHGRPPADRLRRGARRALGHLGVGLQRRRSPRQLSVQGVRRPGPRPEARTRRRARRRALRDGARRDGRPAAARRATCDGSAAAGLRGRLRLLRGDRLHRSRRSAIATARRQPRRPRGRPSCGHFSRTTRA